MGRVNHLIQLIILMWTSLEKTRHTAHIDTETGRFTHKSYTYMCAGKNAYLECDACHTQCIAVFFSVTID